MVLARDLPQLCNYYSRLRDRINNEDECALLFMYGILKNNSDVEKKGNFWEIKSIYQNLEELLEQLKNNPPLTLLKKYEREVEILGENKNSPLRKCLTDYLKKEEGNIEENIRRVGINLGKTLEMKSPVMSNYLKQDEGVIKEVPSKYKWRR